MNSPLDTRLGLAGEVDGGLVDRFHRRVQYLRLSVIDRCNFRCRYCMPASGIAQVPSAEILSFEEILRLVSVLVGLGVRRVRLTGGEPLLRRQLPSLVAKLVAVEGLEEVVMTTNGSLLDRFAPALFEAGLREVTVSLDTLDPERFRAISRRGDLRDVLRGVDAAEAAGLKIKLNAVVIEGFNDDEVVSMTEWALSHGRLLRFIEFMPVGSDTIWGTMPRGGCVTAEEIRRRLGDRWDLVPSGSRSDAGPARYLKLSGEGPMLGGLGHVGIVAAVSECFCSTCNRVRVTSQGGLRACLAEDRETDLRALLRSGADDDALAGAVRDALWGKKEAHRFDIEGGHVTEAKMVSIGG